MNKRELKEALADKDWWVELEDAIPGWKLYGWTYRTHASFHTGPNSIMEIRGHERDAILDAIRNERV